MVWLRPAVLLALAAVAAPILIHILARRRAEVLPFPTLRFLRPTALVSLRRHLVEDPLLLALRIAIVAAAVVALAGPLIVTRARREAWNRRIVRATVTTVAPGFSGAASRDRDSVFQTREFLGTSLADGIRRAVEWLDGAPPARRELVIAAPLTIGSLSAADIAEVPRDVGLRFERVGALAGERTVAYGSVRAADGIVDREVTIVGARTSVRGRPASAPAAAGDRAFPIDVVAAPSARPFVDAAITAVLRERVWSPPPTHASGLVLVASENGPLQVPTRAGAIEPWMADAIARLTRDDALHRASARAAGGLDAGRFSQPPWFTVARSRDNRVLVAAAASGDRLVVVTSAPPMDVVLPILVRGLVNAIAVVPDIVPLEIVPIPDAQLTAWSRPAGPPAQPRIESVESDDRRWLWIAAIGLLTVESWVRRSRRRDASASHAEEAARVA
jgi:hypothetical protein